MRNQIRHITRLAAHICLPHGLNSHRGLCRLAQYFGYLRRDPDAAPTITLMAITFWLAKLNQFGGNFIQAEMVKAFISSIEYGDRFGQ